MFRAIHAAFLAKCRDRSAFLDGLNKAINEYRLGNNNMIPLEIENISSFRKLLQDVRDLQKNQVEREEQVYHVCQEEALSAHQKVKTMETLLEKMRTKQNLLAARNEQKQLDDQVCSAAVRNLN